MAADGMWGRVMLEGIELDAAVARVLDLPAAAYSTDWAAGGLLIEQNQIFINPPHDVHVNGGPHAGWNRYNVWTATVSKRVRSYPVDGQAQGHVGRGAGTTCLVASMRAIVASFGEQHG
jgi:hypothetical protein